MTDLEIVIATLREEANRLYSAGLPENDAIARSFIGLADKLEVKRAEKVARQKEEIQQTLASLDETETPYPTEEQYG